MKVIDLNGKWKGECVFADGSEKFPFEGVVPGSTINDLIRAGKLPSDYREPRLQKDENLICVNLSSAVFF